MHDDPTSTSANGGARQRTFTLGIGYGRLSRKIGRNKDNVAIQHREIDECIDDMSWKRGPWFEDNKSASQYSTKPRDGYELMLAYIQGYQPPTNATVKLVIVITEMERLYRKLPELLSLIEMAKTTYLAAIHSTDGEAYDLSTPEGIHQAIGAVNNAMRESNKLSRRQRRKKQNQAKEGKWSGGGRPYGYEPDGMTIRVAEAKIVIESVERIIAGETLASVVRDLNERGEFQSHGKPWQLANFRRTIIKKRYVIGGKCPIDQETNEAACEQPCVIPHAIREHEPENGDPKGEYPAMWPGIISAEDHALLIGQLSRNTRPGGRMKGRVYLLSGIAECGGGFPDRECCAAMYGQNRKLSTGKRQRRYRCKTYDNHGLRTGCGHVYRDAAMLDALVIEAVLFRLDTPEVAAALANKGEEDKAKDLAQELIRLRLKRKDINRELALADSDDAQDLREQLETVRERMTTVQAQLSQTHQDTARMKLPGNSELRAIFEGTNLEMQRSIIQLVLIKAVVRPASTNKFNPEDVELIWRI